MNNYLAKLEAEPMDNYITKLEAEIRQLKNEINLKILEIQSLTCQMKELIELKDYLESCLKQAKQDREK